MDFIRTGYTCQSRVWQDDGTSIPIRWFRADPGALDFPFENSFLSSNWDQFRVNPLIGEQGMSTRGYDKGANSAGLTGLDHCGTPLDWMNGGVH